jgi:hypothetical protein
MGMKLAKDAVKIGFADISIQDGTPSQPFSGYFIDSIRSVESRQNTYFKLAAEESCFKEPVYVDDTNTTMVSNTVPIENLPANEDLTTPPNKMKMLDDPIVQAVILGAGVYLFIKLVS